MVTFRCSLIAEFRSLLQTIPLQELKLDVYLPTDADESDADCFQARHFKKLLQLLAATNLQRLGLTDLDLIPDPPENFTMSNVKSLKLSGNCNLKKTVRRNLPFPLTIRADVPVCFHRHNSCVSTTSSWRCPLSLV